MGAAAEWWHRGWGGEGREGKGGGHPHLCRGCGACRTRESCRQLAALFGLMVSSRHWLKLLQDVENSIQLQFFFNVGFNIYNGIFNIAVWFHLNEYYCKIGLLLNFWAFSSRGCPCIVRADLCVAWLSYRSFRVHAPQTHAPLCLGCRLSTSLSLLLHCSR